MKKIFALLIINIGFASYAQVTINYAQVTGATLPENNNGSIQLDTTGKNLKSWILYKVENHTTGPMMSYNELLMDSLPIGNYWLLGTSKDPNYPFNYCFEAQYSIGVKPSNPCPTSNNLNIFYLIDSLPNGPKLDYFCAQPSSNILYQDLQWYSNANPMSSFPTTYCNFAIQDVGTVLTLVGFNGTCNESKIITSGLSNLTYPYAQVYAGSGSNTGANNSTASIEESSLENFNIYPNPTDDIIKIVNNNHSNQNNTIEIKDIDGKIIYKNHGIIESISLKSIADSGLYFMTIMNEKNEVVKNTKIVLH